MGMKLAWYKATGRLETRKEKMEPWIQMCHNFLIESQHLGLLGLSPAGVVQLDHWWWQQKTFVSKLTLMPSALTLFHMIKTSFLLSTPTETARIYVLSAKNARRKLT